MFKRDLSRFLNDELKKRQQQNPRYSSRAFARDLSLSPATYSQIVSGKRKVTQRTVLRIASRLGLTGHQTLQIACSVLGKEINAKNPADDDQWPILPDDQFEFLSDWHHFAIMSLGRLKKNQDSAKWISNRLAIPESVASEALERLKRMGFVKHQPDGSFTSVDQLRLPHETPREANRKFHKQTLDLAKSKIESVDISQRDFSAVTMTIDPSKIPLAKEMLQQFRREFCAELETGNLKEVYTLALQFFPLSNENSELKKD